MPYFRITDKGQIERSEVVEAASEEAAQDAECSIPIEEAEVEWVERLVESVDSPDEDGEDDL